MQLFDTAVIDASTVRKTKAGFLVAHARTARTGIQNYRASELGITDGDPNRAIPVYRPPEIVFHDSAMRSMANKPMVRNHPKEDVTAKNWKRLSTGDTGSEIIRDGDFIRHDLILMDAQAVEDYEAGRLKELSWGYSTTIEMRDGVTPEGEPYQAILTSPPDYNHLATCMTARGGKGLRIGDEDEDHQPGDKPMKTMLVDGFSVEVTDQAETAINRILGQLADSKKALTDAQTQVGALTTQVAAKDGEIVVLKKDLEDATSPANLEAAVKARSGLLDTAKIILGDKFDPKGKSDTEIKKAIVTARVGDALAATLADAALDGAYTAIAATAGKTGTVVKDGIRESVLDGAGEIQDARALRDAAREKSLEKSRNAYLGEEA